MSKLHTRLDYGIETHDDLNPLVDMNQVNKSIDNAEKEIHIQEWGFSGGSNLGGCKDLRAMRTAGIELPENTGLKNEKGAMQIGTMIHEDTETKLKQKYKSHKDIRVVSEVYIKLPVVEGTGKKIEVGVDTKRFKRGDILYDDGLTVISPIDNKYVRVKDTTQPLVNIVPTKFRNKVFKIPFLNEENCTTLKDIDIKGQGDYAFFLHLKEGLPTTYVYQGTSYMKFDGQKFIDFLLTHKEKNWRYIIRLFYKEDVWEQLVQDQERMLELTYEYLKNGFVSDNYERDFACLNGSISWYSCPLSRTKEVRDKIGKRKLELLSFCPKAMNLINELKLGLMPVGGMKKKGKYTYYIDSYGHDEEDDVDTISIITKTEMAKKDKGKKYKTTTLSLADAWRKLKDPHELSASFPANQQIVKLNNADLTVQSCLGCVRCPEKQGHCDQYNCIPHSFPSRPDWCQFPQRDLNWELEQRE